MSTSHPSQTNCKMAKLQRTAEKGPANGNQNIWETSLRGL